MKKLFAILLIAVLSVSLVACGEKDQKPLAGDTTDETQTSDESAAIRASFEKADVYVTSVLSKNDIQTQIQDDNGGKDIYKTWFMPGNENAEIIEDIEIAGNKITLLKTNGTDLSGFKDVKLSVSSDQVAKNNNVSFHLTKGTQYCDLNSEMNETDETKTADDMTVAEVATGYGKDALPFTYNGLTAESTLKDVLDTMGTPNATLQISAANLGTTIDAGYMYSVEENKILTEKYITFTLLYDADKDTATLQKIVLRKEVRDLSKEQAQ